MKKITSSQRAYAYLLEHCIIKIKDGSLKVIFSNGDECNIPSENTMFVMLGTGTSITNLAVRELSQANVIICFGNSNTGCFYSGTKNVLLPNKNNVTNKYIVNFLNKYIQNDTDLSLSKKFLFEQFKNIQWLWDEKCVFEDYGLYSDSIFNLKIVLNEIQNINQKQDLLLYEGRMKDKIYQYIASLFDCTFKREKINPKDNINIFLNIGYSIMYGYASTTLWCLGLPPQFPILHGKTNNGGLVYDVADFWKTAIITPMAFIANDEGMKKSNS